MVALASGVWLAGGAAVAIAVQSLAVRASTRTQPVSNVVAVMYVVNLLVLLPAAAVTSWGSVGAVPSPRAAVAFAVSGVVGSLLARYALFTGIARIGASRAEPLKSTFPLVAVGAAILVLGESVTARLAAGVGLIVVGAAVVSRDSRQSPVTADGRRAWVDLGYPLFAALLLGVDPVVAKVGLATGTPAPVGLAVRMTAAAAAFGLYLLWRRRAEGSVPIRPTRPLLVAGAANTVYLGAYLGALARAPVSVVTPILGVSPLLVLVGSALLFQSTERVTARLAVGVTVIVVGVALVV